MKKHYNEKSIFKAGETFRLLYPQEPHESQGDPSISKYCLTLNERKRYNKIMWDREYSLYKPHLKKQIKRLFKNGEEID